MIEKNQRGLTGLFKIAIMIVELLRATTNGLINLQTQSVCLVGVSPFVVFLLFDNSIRSGEVPGAALPATGTMLKSVGRQISRGDI